VIYLDHNASTPIHSTVLERMLPFLSDRYGNPSSDHAFGVGVRGAVEEARQEVADLLGCDPGEIVFTSGATEANSLALHGVMEGQPGRRILISAVEHPSVKAPCVALRDRGFLVDVLGVDRTGRVDVNELDRRLTADTALVSVMHANNETGTVQPIAELARAAKMKGVLFHTDAAQTVGKIPVLVGRLGVDLLSIAGHKFNAPQGVGALFVRAGTKLRPFLLGGGQEGGRRSGTENVASIVGLGAACAIAKRRLAERPAQLVELRDRLWARLKAGIPELKLNGNETFRLPNTLNFCVPGCASSELLQTVTEVAASTGSACHQGAAATVSATLLAMGLRPEEAERAIRVSVGVTTTVSDVDVASDRIVEAWRALVRRQSSANRSPEVETIPKQAGGATTPPTAPGCVSPVDFRGLPSVDRVLGIDGIRRLLDAFPRWAVVRAVRSEVARHREAVRRGREGNLHIDVGRIRAEVQAIVRPSLRRAINATGVVLHTNLGRAPLSSRALAAVQDVARSYSTLEYDPSGRARGSRSVHVSAALTELVGAQAALVVNNNAGAVLLTLAALAGGRTAIVSRGELVEIGGGFRIPDVMRSAGIALVEIGTTNRTRLDDYRAAISSDTAILLKVHSSNFAIVGFTEDASIHQLAGLAREYKIPLVFDLGSGSLVAGSEMGVSGEPTVAEAIAAGADVCLFSGDKLLGGPQAGIVVGRSDLLARLRRHPLYRALRPDKMCLAALAATLEHYRDGTALQAIPALSMLTSSLESLAVRKDLLQRALDERAVSSKAEILTSAVGGGALPTAELPSWSVLITTSVPADVLASELSTGTPTVATRIHRGYVALDVRTVAEDEVQELAEATAAGLRRVGSTTPADKAQADSEEP
jgi:L-seryl-tRNA(Ser) seleniumtransferase